MQQNIEIAIYLLKEYAFRKQVRRGKVLFAASEDTINKEMLAG